MSLLTQEEIQRIPPEERLAMISDLWDSLTPDEIPLTTAQRDELDRCLETLDEDRKARITWEELRAELESR